MFCLLFPISPRDSSSTKKSPALGNKSCQAQYRNLLSVVMCARFTFELWILISSPCLGLRLPPSIHAASYSNRFDTIFLPLSLPFFIHRQISSTCQFYVSIFVQRDYEFFSEGNYGSLEASTPQTLRDLLDVKSLPGKLPPMKGSAERKGRFFGRRKSNTFSFEIKSFN